jgi:hypothetical protein
LYDLASDTWPSTNALEYGAIRKRYGKVVLLRGMLQRLRFVKHTNESGDWSFEFIIFVLQIDRTFWLHIVVEITIRAGNCCRGRVFGKLVRYPFMPPQALAQLFR